MAANVAWNRNGGIAITLPKRFKAARPEPATVAGKSAESLSVYRIFFLAPHSFSLISHSNPFSPFLFSFSLSSLRRFYDIGAILAFGGRLYYIFGEAFAAERSAASANKSKLEKPRWIYRGKKRVRGQRFSSYDRRRRRWAMDRKGETRGTVVSAIRYWPLKILVT